MCYLYIGCWQRAICIEGAVRVLFVQRVLAVYYLYSGCSSVLFVQRVLALCYLYSGCWQCVCRICRAGYDYITLNWGGHHDNGGQKIFFAHVLYLIFRNFGSSGSSYKGLIAASPDVILMGS